MICPDCGKDVHGYTAMGIHGPVEHGCPPRKHPWQVRAEKAEARVTELEAERSIMRTALLEIDKYEESTTYDAVKVFAMLLGVNDTPSVSESKPLEFRMSPGDRKEFEAMAEEQRSEEIERKFCGSAVETGSTSDDS